MRVNERVAMPDPTEQFAILPDAASLKALGFSENAALDQSRDISASSGGMYTAASRTVVGGAKAYDMYTEGSGQKSPAYGPPGDAGYPLEYLG